MDFDPHNPELIADPQGTFGVLRDDFPVFDTTIGGQPVRLVTRHADVTRVMNDPSALMNRPGTQVPDSIADGPAGVLWRTAVSMMDPPEHTRVRRAIGGAFTRRSVRRMRPQVENVVKGVFESLGAEETECVHDVSLKVPLLVICGLLGIPVADWPRLEAWTNDFLRIFLPEAATAEEVARIHDASRHFIEYFGQLIDARMDAPQADLTSDLVRDAVVAGDISREELIGALRGLLTAGFETTAATISASFLGFANQPDQLEQLKLRPETIPDAVHELLRWETPVQAMVRYPGREIEMHDTTLAPGEAIWLLMGASNHDPRRYPDPERIDVGRDASDHHAFGGGRHFCLGAYLARVELECVLEEMARRYTRIEIADDAIARRPNFQFRSIESLTVTLS